MSDWNLGLDPTPVTGTDPDEAMNRINFHDHSGVGKGEPIDSRYVINTPAGDITATSTQTAIAQLNVLANLGRVHVPVRQTVLSGSTDVVTGLPNFLNATSGLSVSISATSTPLIIAFAYNFDSDYGALDYIGKVTADITGAWSSLPANQTCYLYIDRNVSTGVLTYGYSLFAPVYQTLAPSAPSTDQHWFDLNSFYMKRYNGTTWENKQRVFVGECVTDASSVTDLIVYGLRGYYDSGEFDIEIATTYTKTPNLGLLPGDLEVDGYVESGGEYRPVNIIGRGSSTTVTGNSGGDMIWQTKNAIRMRINNDRIHPSYSSGPTNQLPNSATTGKARLFAKRRW